MGFLQIIDNTDLQDWEKSGYWLDHNVGLIQCPTLKLLPFTTPNKLISSATISEFKVKRVKVSNGVKTVVQTTSLSIALLVKVVGVTYDNWYYLAATNQAALSQGIYEFYIKTSDNIEWKSDLFCIPNSAIFVDCNPDFNDDFNKDHLICAN